VQDFALATPPPGWIWCDGAILLPSTPYAILRSLLIADGFLFGNDGSGNPRVPDARGRVVAGRDNMGGTAASRITSASSGFDGATLGAAGGNQAHTLTTAQMPQHAHSVTDPGHAHGATQDAHTHTVQGLAFNRAASGYGLASPGAGYNERVPLYPTGSTTSPAYSDAASANGVTVNSGSTGISIQNNGSGQAHLNVQPTIVFNKIIFAGE
jgi:microcystin-dependent protein